MARPILADARAVFARIEATIAAPAFPAFDFRMARLDLCMARAAAGHLAEAEATTCDEMPSILFEATALRGDVEAARTWLARQEPGGFTLAAAARSLVRHGAVDVAIDFVARAPGDHECRLVAEDIVSDLVAAGEEERARRAAARFPDVEVRESDLLRRALAMGRIEDARRHRQLLRASDFSEISKATDAFCDAGLLDDAIETCAGVEPPEALIFVVAVLPRLLRDRPEEAMRAVDRFLPTVRSPEAYLKDVMEAVLEARGPAAALALLPRIGDTTWRLLAEATIRHHAGEQERLLAIADEIDPGRPRDRVLGLCVESCAAARQIEQAIDCALRIGRTHERWKALGHLAREAAKTDPDAALAVAKRIKFHSVRAGAEYFVLEGFLERDDEARALVIARKLPDAQIRGMAMCRIVEHRIARGDLAAAAELTRGFTDGGLTPHDHMGALVLVAIAHAYAGRVGTGYELLEQVPDATLRIRAQALLGFALAWSEGGALPNRWTFIPTASFTHAISPERAVARFAALYPSVPNPYLPTERGPVIGF